MVVFRELPTWVAIGGFDFALGAEEVGGGAGGEFVARVLREPGGEGGVGFINDGEGVAALDDVRFRRNAPEQDVMKMRRAVPGVDRADGDLVAEVVEAKLGADAVGHVARVGGALFLRRGALGEQSGGQAEEGESGARELAIAPGEVAVDRGDVRAVAVEGEAKSGEQGDEGFAFAGGHFGELSPGQREAGVELAIVRGKSARAADGFGDEGDGSGVQGLRAQGLRVFAQAGDLGNAVSTTATSAADGTYTFASLRPGTYTLTETQPAGYLDGIDTAGAAGGTPANDSFSAIEPAAVFAFDTFRNLFPRVQRAGLLPGVGPIDVSREALLPLAPVYSGEADPGATLVVALYNARGEEIGSQTVMVDSGGNWLTSFASSIMRDTPSSVRISLLPAPASYGDSFGHNLRAYFSPALNPGHFFETIRDLGFDRGSAPLLDGLGLENPLQLGSVKYGGELLSTQGTASGE